MAGRTELIKRASLAGIIGNALLAFLKIGVGLWSGSLAVLADGVDSTGDVFGSVIILYTSYLLLRPPSTKFPYGYGKAEAIATKSLAFILFFAGVQLIIESIRSLIQAEQGVFFKPIVFCVLILSIIVKIVLAKIQLRIGRNTESKLLIANGKNMQADIFISLSVLVGIGFSYFLQFPLIDNILALMVALWIFRVAYRIFIDTNLELMDALVDKDLYQKIFSIIDEIDEVHNPHRMRVRKIGHSYMIAVDLEMDPGMTLQKAHYLSHVVERKIKETVDNVFDVAIHMEPVGINLNEKDIGVSRKNLTDLNR
jgi:cation diffusion facilitator family transporter